MKKDELIQTLNTTIKALEGRLQATQAQLVHRYYFASLEVAKLDTKRFAGSSVVLTVTDLSGKTLIEPIAIRGGLSDDTIKALQADMLRSFEDAIELAPVGYKKET